MTHQAKRLRSKIRSVIGRNVSVRTDRHRIVAVLTRQRDGFRWTEYGEATAWEKLTRAEMEKPEAAGLLVRGPGVPVAANRGRPQRVALDTRKGEQVTLPALISQNGLTVDSVFVPFSKSRNAVPNPKLKDLSLNWEVTVKKGDRVILTTDYQQGIGHCVAPNGWLGAWNVASPTIDCDAEVRAQCETGTVGGRLACHPRGTRIPAPEGDEVLANLAWDATVLDYPTFEKWARSYDYDLDSRKAEGIYKACLDIALKLRNGLGEAVLAELIQEASNY